MCIWRRYAAEVGVSLMTFDNKAELHKIKEHYPTAELVLRIIADDPNAVVPVRGSYSNKHTVRNVNVLIMILLRKLKISYCS